MNERAISEKLNSIRNEMNHLWGTTFLFGGGSLALILQYHNIISCILGFIGFIFMFLFFNAYIIRRNEVVKLVKKLETEL